MSGTLTATGHTTFEGVTSTGATGTGKLVYDNTPTLVTPNIGAATGTSLTTSGALNATNGLIGASSTSIVPITLFVKNVTVGTSGSPADIATITVPAGITRYVVNSSVSSQGTSSPDVAFMIAETASGTLAGAAFEIHTASGGSGTTLVGMGTGPTTAGAIKGARASALVDASSVPSSSTLYIYQLSNSANAGTMSFYITILPLP